MKRKSYFLILIAVMALASCKKDEPVPVGYINIEDVSFNPTYTKCDIQCIIKSNLSLDEIILEYSTDSTFATYKQVPMYVTSISNERLCSASLSGLNVGCTYYIRCRALNSYIGKPMMFTTKEGNPFYLYYTATSKLTVDETLGIPTESHTFDDGKGTIVLYENYTDFNNAFTNQSALLTLEIPNCVAMIEYYAFAGCSNLKSVTIPNSVTNLGKGIFMSCDNLTSIICKATTPPKCISSYTWDGVSSSILIYVPAESVEKYESASYWTYFKNILPL